MKETMATAEVKTVPYVDLQRYMGRWYEISSYPKWFEKGLTGVSALYTARDGYVEVLNSGYKKGKMHQARGKALVVNGWGGARLKVSFFPFLYGKYWIINLAEDYSWVVVSNPKRSALWILCRKKTINPAIYQTIIERLQSNGFNTLRLVKMEQEERM